MCTDSMRNVLSVPPDYVNREVLDGRKNKNYISGRAHAHGGMYAIEAGTNVVIISLFEKCRAQESHRQGDALRKNGTCASCVNSS